MACEYCEDQVVMPLPNQTNKFKYISIDSDGRLVLLNDYTVTKDLVKANYCFHCGEKLGDTNE